MVELFQTACVWVMHVPRKHLMILHDHLRIQSMFTPTQSTTLMLIATLYLQCIISGSHRNRKCSQSPSLGTSGRSAFQQIPKRNIDLIALQLAAKRVISDSEYRLSRRMGINNVPAFTIFVGGALWISSDLSDYVHLIRVLRNPSLDDWAEWRIEFTLKLLKQLDWMDSSFQSTVLNGMNWRVLMSLLRLPIQRIRRRNDYQMLWRIVTALDNVAGPNGSGAVDKYIPEIAMSLSDKVRLCLSANPLAIAIY